MKIRQKLISGFLVVVVLIAIIGIVSLVSMENIGTRTETHHTLNMPIQAAISHIRIDLEEIVRATEEYDADWMTKEESSEEIIEKKEYIEIHLENLSAASGLFTPEEVEDLKGSVDELYDLSAKLFLLHGKTRAERAPIMKEFDEKIEELDENLGVFLERIDEASKASMDSIVNTVASSRIILISVLAAVILAALGTTFVISRSISNPIAKLRDVTIEISKGDLTKRAEVKSKDEIGELATSFNQMTESLQKSRDEILEKNQELETMNEELRASNEELQATEEELRASNEELQTANEELREAQEKVVRSERLAAIGQLAGGVGHELRNPLGAIKNAVYYIRGKVAKNELAQKEPRVIEFLDIMDDEINSSNKIINDLLGFSRVGKPAVSPARIERVIEDALSRTPIPENIRLTKKLDSDLPQVEIDTDQVRQVLINIIINAVQAMPEGGKLTMSAREKDELLEVEITDSGCGMPKEVMDKIFDPLFTTRAKGIGLGLAVCKAIIDRHEGNITVKSEPGRGTTFTIRLPLKAA